MTGCDMLDYGTVARKNGKRLPCESLAAKNAELREQVADACMQLGCAWVRCTELCELVRDLWRFTKIACEKYPKLFDPAAQGGQMVQLNAIDAFEQRLSELGIEVE